MTNMIRRRYEMLVRILAFCVERLALFEAVPPGAKMVATLKAAVAELEARFALTSSGRTTEHEGTVLRNNGRAALRRSLHAITRTAALVGLQMEGVAERFPAPRLASIRELVADARSMAENAAPLREAFLAHGLPASVLDDLPAQIAVVERAIHGQATGRAARAGAHASVRAALASGSAAVDVLEKILLNVPDLDPNTAALWKSARWVGPARGKDATPPAPQGEAGTKVA